MEIEDSLKEAIIAIQDFVGKTTGKNASQKEIALALKKYFVLKEILDFIMMERSDNPE